MVGVSQIGDDGRMGAVIRGVALGVAFSVCGCSWIFMERPPKHGDTGEPRCTGSKGWAAWDGLILGVDVVTAIAAASASSEPVDRGDGTKVSYAPLILVALADGLIHAASMGSGIKWANECRAARVRYDAQEDFRRVDPSPPPMRERERDIGPGPVTPAARYFCTTSPTDSAIGACNTTREGCAASQGKLVDAGNDVGPCIAAPAAVCFSAAQADGSELTGCAPTIGSCRRNREIATLNEAYVSVGECSDR